MSTVVPSEPKHPSEADSKREALFNRNFLLLWQGQLVSQLGNQAYFLAMMYWLMEATGSASLMGLLMMVSLLPGVLLGPFGGAMADRHSRLGIIVWSDVARGCAVLGLAGLMYFRPQSVYLITQALFAIALFSGVINAAFQPAIHAAIPDLVPRARVAAANSLTQFSVQASTLVGQAAGGILYRMLGSATLFVVDGLTYLFSAVSEAFIRIPRKTPVETVPMRQTAARYVKDTGQGIRYVWQRTGMRTFLQVAAAVNFLAMPVVVLLPFYVTDRLLEDSAWYGFLLAALGGGALLGYALVGAMRISAERRPWAIIAALFGVAILFVAAGFVRTPIVAGAIFLAVGICTGTINIFVITLFQITTPEDMRGRVMGLVIALSSAATPLGMALGGVLGDATNKNVPLLYTTCGVLIAVVVAVAACSRSFRSFLEWEAPAELHR